MKINLRKSATATPAARGCIQASTKTAVALCAELGVSMTTIYKWKQAGRTQDGSHARHNLGASALPRHEAIIRELRVGPCLSLEDIIEVMSRCQPAEPSRGAASRCLRRLGLNQRTKPKQTHGFGCFEPTPCGYVHIDLKVLTG